MSAITRIRFVGSCFGHLEHLSAQRSARSAVGALAAMRSTDAAQVLDQREPQHDRNGPQLAQRQACVTVW